MNHSLVYMVVFFLAAACLSCEKRDGSATHSLTPCYNIASGLHEKISIIERKSENFINDFSELDQLKVGEVKEFYVSINGVDFAHVDWVDVSILALLSGGEGRYEIWQVYPVLVRISCDIDPSSHALECGSLPYPYRLSR